jgi:flagellar basal body-associated protein FliL
MSWKEFNDWAEQEKKKKVWWIPIAIVIFIFCFG